jgi:hypothetical protein
MRALPLLILGREGLAGAPVAAAAAAELARSFARDLLIRLPSFLEPELLARFRSRLDPESFKVVRVGSAEVVQSHALDSTLCFLLNDPALFAFVAEVCGTGPIGGFIGQIRRVEPGKGTIGWHDDMHSSQRRLAAFTLNLSAGAYEGGTLQIARRGEPGILREEINAVPGDALLFRIAPDLVHRNTPVTGPEPKIMFSGWFCAEPFSSLRRG